METSNAQLRDHLIIIFSELRNRVIKAIQMANLPLFNQCLEILNTLLKSKDGCKILVETQKLITQNPNPKTLALSFQSDYLCPFFDLHPADFHNGFRFVSPDISSSSSINMMRSQYISLMDSMNVTNVSNEIDFQSRTYRHRFSLSSYDVRILEWSFENGWWLYVKQEMNYWNHILRIHCQFRPFECHLLWLESVVCWIWKRVCTISQKCYLIRRLWFFVKSIIRSSQTPSIFILMTLFLWMNLDFIMMLTSQNVLWNTVINHLEHVVSGFYLLLSIEVSNPLSIFERKRFATYHAYVLMDIDLWMT